MDTYIKDMFEKHYPIQITKNIFREIELFCIKFETRGTHPLALNSQTIAVHPFFFTTKDQDAIFDIFTINKTTLTNKITSIKTIDESFKVTSDALNMFLIWLAYRGYTSPKLNKKEQQEFAFIILKILHYKFFTSFVNHMLCYGANEDIMNTVIESLNKKFDIVQYGTWKKVIEARTMAILEKESVHYNAINTFTDDNAVKFIITDIQTNIKNKLKIIISKYHEYKEHSKSTSISTYTTVNTIDGDKIFTNTGIAYDSMINGVMSQILNTKAFINMEIIKLLAKEFSSINTNMLQSFLTSFSILAIAQSKDGILDTEKIIVIENNQKIKIYSGIRKLVTNFIQKAYRYCIQNKINLNSKKDIYLKIKNLFTASRVIDPEILVLKESMMYIVEQCGTYTRLATKASLRIAVVMYILILSMDYLK